MPLALSELIRQYGDDKVQFQNLDQSLTNLSVGKGVTKITFGTEQTAGLDGTDKLGLIVWLDRARVKEITAASKTKSEPT